MVQNKNKKKKNVTPTPASQQSFGKVVRAPVASTKKQENVGPQVITGANGVLRVKHREFVRRLTTGTVYRMTLNPGLITPFPWLSQIAAAYETYQIKRLVFQYDPVCPTTSSGMFAAFIDYDPSDDYATTLDEFLASYRSVSGPLWSPNKMVFDPKMADAYKKRFIRQAALVDWQNTLYDSGTAQFYVGTTGSDFDAGLLWMEYEVEFYTPQHGGAQAGLVSTDDAETATSGADDIIGFCDNGDKITQDEGCRLFTIEQADSDDIANGYMPLPYFKFQTREPVAVNFKLKGSNLSGGTVKWLEHDLTTVRKQSANEGSHVIGTFDVRPEQLGAILQPYFQIATASAAAITSVIVTWSRLRGIYNDYFSVHEADGATALDTVTQKTGSDVY